MSTPLADAIGLATEAARTHGGPFGAVIELDGQQYAATNTVTHANDPTAHAEVQAIRHAARLTGSHDLTGATLYTSTYPCPMCFGAAMWAGVSRIVYAAGPRDAEAAGFSDDTFWQAMRDTSKAPLTVTQDPRPDRLAPFEAWARNPYRRPY